MNERTRDLMASLALGLLDEEEAARAARLAAEDPEAVEELEAIRAALDEARDWNPSIPAEHRRRLSQPAAATAPVKRRVNWMAAAAAAGFALGYVARGAWMNATPRLEPAQTLVSTAASTARHLATAPDGERVSGAPRAAAGQSLAAALFGSPVDKLADGGFEWVGLLLDGERIWQALPAPAPQVETPALNREWKRWLADPEALWDALPAPGPDTAA